MNELNEVITKLLSKNLSSDLQLRITNLDKSLTDQNMEEIFNEIMKILDEIEDSRTLETQHFLNISGSIFLSIGIFGQYIYPEFTKINLWYGLLGLSFVSLGLIT